MIPSERNPSRPSNQHRPSKPDFKPGNQNKPIAVRRPGYNQKPDRQHPRYRDFMHYSKPSYHWSPRDHYYGYRVRTLPINAHRHVYRGITYYFYDNIWYRPFGSYYTICRPPFGTVLAANIIADVTWTAVKLSYYNTVANTYRQINENNQYIQQQNAIIAQQNAIIASQNSIIAQSYPKANEAYGLANELGLVQSYAAADAAYYYQDGVFYTMDSSGRYSVIVPPAGALVEVLPEDYEVVNIGGKEYYRVDDTIYRTTISEGKPYFEVVGQM